MTKARKRIQHTKPDDELLNRVTALVWPRLKRWLIYLFCLLAAAITVFSFLWRGAEKTKKTLMDDLQELNKRVTETSNRAIAAVEDANRANENATVAIKMSNDALSLLKQVQENIEETGQDADKVADEIQATLSRIQQEIAATENKIMLVWKMPSSLEPSLQQTGTSVENRDYQVTIYFNEADKELFNKCLHKLSESGFTLRSLERKRAQKMFDELWPDSFEPSSSLDAVGTNTITSTKDALIKATEIRDLLQEIDVDLGEVILDWETFRKRYGDSMLTKGFPNASHLIEIYLLGTKSSSKE